MMIALLVITTFMASIGGVIVTSHGAYLEFTAASTADELTHRVLDRIVWELRFADPDTITLSQPTNAPSITYRKVQGWQNTAALLTAQRTIAHAATRVTLDGVVIGDRVSLLTFNRTASAITVVVEVERTVTTSGSLRTHARRLEATIPL